MKRLDPFMLFLLAVVIFLVSLLVLENISKQLNEDTQQLNSVQYLSKQYKAVKSWSIKDKVTHIKKLARLSRVNNIDIKKQDTLIVIKAKNVKTKAIDSFINKILNDRFIIKYMDISKDNFTIKVYND